MFLTAEEIKELTKRTQHRAQVQALRALGITHKIRADGSPLVLRSHIEKELGGLPGGHAATKDFQPNWDGINA